MKLYSIETGNFKLDGGAMFGVVPKIMWSSVYEADENNLCNFAMRCLLIVDGDRKILIDNGLGDKLDDKFLKYYFLNGDDTLEKSLKNKGFSFDDITDVVLTHLHFDHCGGSITYNDKKELVPTFPNATYHTSKQQWDWAQNPNRREKPSMLRENIQPIKDSGNLNLFDKDCELFPNIEIKLFFGHTDGMVIPHINYHGKTIVYGGDLFPTAAHIPLSFIPAYDTRPLLTYKEREDFYKDAIANDYIIFFEHDVNAECCSLKETEKGVKVNEVFSLEKFIDSMS